MASIEEDLASMAFRNQDLKEQLGGALDTVMSLYARGTDLRKRLFSYVEQGRGLTPQQLDEFYTDVVKIFPIRTRRSSAEMPQTALDTSL